MMIKDFQDGLRLKGRYFINEVKKGVTTGAKAYLTITFQDCSGQIEAKVWDYTPEDEGIFEKGKVIEVDAVVITYNNKFQLKVFQGYVIPQADIDWSLYVPSAPVPQEELEKKLHAYLDSFSDPVVRDLVHALLNQYMDKYLQWPAASKNHHNFVSGLLYHSLTMGDIAIRMCEIYPSLNRDIVLGGVLVHDIGKVMELSGPNATAYTLQGKLVGHISIGHGEVREAAKNLGYYAFLDLSPEEQAANEASNSPVFHRYEVAITFEHIVLSHHGRLDFGSPILPQTREAIAISMIDDFDAKMLILDNAFVGVKLGESSARIFSMDNRAFYLPHYSSETHDPYGLDEEEAKKSL